MRSAASLFRLLLVLLISMTASAALATTESSSKRQAWDGFRFLQQSSKFVTVPLLGARGVEKQVRPGDVLWQAAKESKNDFTMAPLDDVVMGGASSSTFDASTGTWAGRVTDANNGGFIGIRSTPKFRFNMETCKGLEWKVKSTASTTTMQRYKFVVRDSEEFNGITWTTCVNVKPGNAIRTARILFDRQVPALFAKTVPNQTFQKSNVVGVQVAYSKFEYDGELNPRFAVGDVKLQLLELKAI